MMLVLVVVACVNVLTSVSTPSKDKTMARAEPGAKGSQGFAETIITTKSCTWSDECEATEEGENGLRRFCFHDLQDNGAVRSIACAKSKI